MKCTLVPSDFYNDDCAREYLAQVVVMDGTEEVNSVFLEEFSSWLVYAGAEGEYPELYYILRSLYSCTEYNKILCSWEDGEIALAIAQGKTLLLANSYPAPDFTTAQYYIFLAMKSLQLNPEVSTICWLKPISEEEEMSLYRYFKSVNQFRQA